MQSNCHLFEGTNLAPNKKLPFYPPGWGVRGLSSTKIGVTLHFEEWYALLYDWRSQPPECGGNNRTKTRKLNFYSTYESTEVGTLQGAGKNKFRHTKEWSLLMAPLKAWRVRKKKTFRSQGFWFLCFLLLSSTRCVCSLLLAKLLRRRANASINANHKKNPSETRIPKTQESRDHANEFRLVSLCRHSVRQINGKGEYVLAYWRGGDDVA